MSEHDTHHQEYLTRVDDATELLNIPAETFFVEPLGQEWRQCRSEPDHERYFTVQTQNGVWLILVAIQKRHGIRENGIVAVPIQRDELDCVSVE
jgi:hypothetical protein